MPDAPRTLTGLTISDECAVCGRESPQVDLMGMNPSLSREAFIRAGRERMGRVLAAQGWKFTANGTFCPDHAMTAGTGGGRT